MLRKALNQVGQADLQGLVLRMCLTEWAVKSGVTVGFVAAQPPDDPAS